MLIVIDHPACHPGLAGGDLAHAAAGSKHHARPQRFGPVGDVGAGLGALGAAGDALAEIDARCTTAVLLCGNRAVRGPPVPAELVEALTERHAGATQRQRRHHRCLGRIGRIARQPRDAHHSVVLGVIGLERAVVDRPVVGHAIEASHPEVRGMKTRKVTGIQHGATAHAVEVGDLDRRVVFVDRIVDLAGAPVGAEMELAHLARFIVAAIARIVGGLDPVALLQTQDTHPGLGKTPGHRRARRPRTDNQHIDRCVLCAHRGELQRPVNCGLRFSTKWATPSLKSAEAKLPAISPLASSIA